MKTIVHLLYSKDFSGAENVALTIITNMRTINNNIRYIYVSQIGNMKKYCEDYEIEFYGLKDFSMRSIKKMIKDLHPDLIHAHDAKASVKSALLVYKIPIISHLHNNNPWMKKKGLYTLLYLFTSYKYKKIILVSKSIENEFVLSKLLKNKMKLVGNPINYKEILKYKDNKKKYDLVFVGRLVEEKNPLLFIEICKKACEKIPELKALILGNGYLYSTVEKEIQKGKLEENIDLMGFVNPPYIYICQSKIQLITSKWEGYGLVAVEAMLLGTVVVAAEVGGLVDLIDGESGYLFTDSDRAAKIVISLLNDKALYNEKRNNLENYTKCFVNDEYYNNLYYLYQEVL